MSSLNTLKEFGTQSNNYFKTSNIDNTITSPNFYENKIKGTLPDYQNQKLNYLTNNYFQESQKTNVNSSNYIDPFKLLENKKTTLLVNNLNSPSQNMNISDLQIKKMIEREMDPYLLQMKNELDMKFKEFLDEMNSKKEIFNEITSTKDTITEYQRLNDINQKNLEKKLFKVTSELNEKQKKLDEIENNLTNLNNSYNKLNKQNEDINNNLNEIGNIKNKLDVFDNIHEKINQEISDSIERVSAMKINQLFNDIKILKEENNSLKTSLSKITMSIDNLNIENKEKSKLIQNISDNNNTFLNEMDNIKINNNQLNNKFDNYDNKNIDLEKKIKSLNDKYNNLNNNINSTSINIEQLKENIRNTNNNIFDIDNKTNNIQSISQNLTNKITLIESSIDSNKEKISRLKNIIDGTINKNNSLMYKDLSDQVSKCKLNMDEFFETYDFKINEISNNLNELKLKIENNPFMQMSNNQRLSQNFKKEVIDSNETFREQIKAITEEISKMQIDRKNFAKIDKNFTKINEQLIKVNSLEKNAKKYPEIFQTLSDKHKSLKEEMQKCFDENAKIFTKKIENLRLEYNNIIKQAKIDMSYGNNSGRQLSPTQMISKESAHQLNDLDLDVKKLRNDCNENTNDINQLKLHIREINENKIPDIYKKLNSNKIPNLSIEPVKNENKNIYYPNNNINNNINNVNKNVNNNFNNNVNNNVNNIINNNVNNNKVNNINNNVNKVNNNVNNNIKVVDSQDYEQLARQIELMNEKNDNDNNKNEKSKYNDNNVHNNDFDNNIQIDSFDDEKSNNNLNLNVKGNDIRLSKNSSKDDTDKLLEKIMKGENLNSSTNNNNINNNNNKKEVENKSGFVDDFDDDEEL